MSLTNMNALDYPVQVFDHVITDPPYSKHVHKSAATMKGGKAGKNELGFDYLSSPLRRHIAKFVAAARRWSLIYCDWEGLHLWRYSLEAAGARYVRAIPWVRWSMPQLSGDRPPQGSECVILARGKSKGKEHWNGPGNLICLEHKALRGEGKHKTEKPLDQMLDLVEWFTDPGETIFDPCAGSGTTLLAAKLLGRSAVGLEIDYEWAEKAHERFSRNELGDRDWERFVRYQVAKGNRINDMARMKAHTSKIRKVRDDEHDGQATG